MHKGSPLEAEISRCVRLYIKWRCRTVADIKAVGGKIFYVGTPYSANRATVSGLTAQQWQDLFRPTIKIRPRLGSEVCMQRPVFRVDFNEMVDVDTVLLSVQDSKTDASGAVISLGEGMVIDICMYDRNENGAIDNLVAQGIVVKNSRTDWSSHVKWCCRIDGNGIRAQSEVGELPPS